MSGDARKRWDARYREEGVKAPEPSPFLLSLDGSLPRKGRALDVAGGTGRHAIWLARRGLEVALVDVSPVGVSLAREAATAAGVRIDARVADLETTPFPAGPWDLVVSFYYLWRPIFAAYIANLSPGGLLVVAQSTRTNLQRHQRPAERFLLADGELPSLIPGLDIVHYQEGWLQQGRHEAQIVARKPH